MNIVRKRDKIRSVKARFESQYKYVSQEWKFSDGGSPHEKVAALAMLDLETCSPEAVNRIIGNDSWTEVKCDECGDDCNFLVRLGDLDEDAGSWADVCFDCLIKALEMMEFG